jgi:hypothetical protein
MRLVLGHRYHICKARYLFLTSDIVLCDESESGAGRVEDNIFRRSLR